MPFLLHNTSLILISVWVALRQDSCLSYGSTPNFTDSLQCKKYKLLWKPTWFKCQCIWNLRTEITELRTENGVSRLRDRHFNMVFWTARRSRHSFQGKGTTYLLSYFKTPSIGLALGIKPATSRSAVQRSTNGVNSAWVKRKLPYCRLFQPNPVPRASLYPIFWSARDWDSNNKEPGQPGSTGTRLLSPFKAFSLSSPTLRLLLLYTNILSLRFVLVLSVLLYLCLSRRFVLCLCFQLSKFIVYIYIKKQLQQLFDQQARLSFGVSRAL